VALPSTAARAVPARLIAPLGVFLLAVLVPAVACGQAPRTLTGTVVQVRDGDTIQVRIGDQIEKVRYIGMSAPEFQHPKKGEQPGGREAMEANRKLVDGKAVRLELDVQERDRYGRLLAYVYVGGVMVNAELVGAGFARVNSTPPNLRHHAALSRRQREARSLRLGLWKDDTRSRGAPGRQP
jgi:micrococcal nuclease